MDLSVEEFIDGLLSKEALETPSDSVRPDELRLELPLWFDVKKFNKGRHFFWDFCYGLLSSMLLGVLVVFSIPTILKVLIATKRSSTPYTAYKRYAATALHIYSWFENELKPGTGSWRSLYAVRSQHLRAGLAGKLKGFGIVSQKDLAITQYGFIGFSMLKPDKFGISQLREDDWDAYNHLWRTIGYMIGLEDRYNICRKTIDETREVCQIIHDKIITPNMENVPEYFEHMSRVFLEGIQTVIPGADVNASLYFCRHLSDVPGYIYTEGERIELRKRLRKKMDKNSFTTGVKSSDVVQQPLYDLPASSRVLYYDDYATLQSNPLYKVLPPSSKFSLHLNAFLFTLNSICFFRFFLNAIFRFFVFTIRYFPFGAFSTFGFKASFIKPFGESPAVDAKLKTNAEYYEEDNRVHKKPWYYFWLC